MSTGEGQDLEILGSDVRGPIGPDRIETFAVPDLDEIEFTTEEVAAVCPVTGQPDAYSTSIRYGPSGRAIESKSLKLYLWSFRDRGIFAEHLAAEVAEDLVAAVVPRWLTVTLRQRVRGGIVTTVTASRPSTDPRPDSDYRDSDYRDTDYRDTDDRDTEGQDTDDRDTDDRDTDDRDTDDRDTEYQDTDEGSGR